LEKRKNLAAAAEELRQKRGRLLPPAADLPGGGKNAEEALKYLEKRLGETEGLIEEYREAREKAGRDLAAAEAGENAARVKLEEGEKQRDEAASALENALKDSPFPSADALREAVLEGGEEAALEEEITRWKEDRSRLLSLDEELGNQLQGLRAETSGMEGSAKDAALSLETLRAGQEEAEAERDRAQRELSALERDWEALKNARERHETLAKTSARLNALADDLAGKNPRKRPFDSWLLSQYLAEVAAFASTRLEKMSEYRYSLLLESGREGGRGYTGLDLAVFDAHTGRTRPCATLSGGESFMAAISLALGLADSIQNRSGGIRLDAVFIDEGFGSLDEESLDKALLILDELGDRRMVGLISHVREMRLRVPSRIEVEKTGSGSHIKAAARE
jgi:exonuclease SbcC